MKPFTSEKKRIVLTFLTGEQLDQVKEEAEGLLDCRYSK